MDSEQQDLWKKALEIYADISELPTNQAITQLDKLNNLSPEIRQVVVTLINSGNQASTYIQKHYIPTNNADTVPQFNIGTIIGEYELLENLGQGGMSQVFRAQRVNDNPQKQVAIKIFSPKNYSQVLLDHFVTEQKILSQLSHTNIVDMLHGGKTDENITYLVMELIENALPINQYFNLNKAGVRTKINYIKQCADALSYSHANLIIHRDLKPDNILIGQNSHLKIVDFGIAKLIKKDVVSDNNTIMALTPSYASPEQINSEQISVKTDIFSLAIVALELLTAKQVLPKDRLIKSCINDEKAIEESLKTVKFDRDLRNILQQALQQDPQKRYASMQSFCDDLSNYLANKPVNATSQSLYYRLKKFAHRRRALFATMISLLASLIVGLLITLWQFQQIKVEAGKAQQVKQFMLDTFNVTNPNISEGNVISANDLLKIAATKLDENSNLNPEIKFELYQALAIANDQLGFSQEAIELLKKSLTIIQDNTKSTSYLAANYLRAEDQQALQLLLSITDESQFDSEIDQAKFSLVRAQNLSIKGDFNQAIDLIKKIKNLKSIKNTSGEFEKTQKILAGIYYEMSEYEKATAIFKSVLSDTKLSKTHTLILSTKLDLGRTYNTMGKHNLALEQFNQIESVYKQVLGNKHPDLGGLYLRMASSFKATGQLPQAHKYAQLSYDTNVLVFGFNGAQVAASLNMLAVLAQSDGNIDKAINLTEKAIVLLETSYDLDNPKTLELKTNLAVLFGFNLQHDKSLKMLKQVYAIQKNKLGPKHFSTLNTEGSIVTALTHLKLIKQAKELALLHLHRVLEQDSPTNILTLNAYSSLARVYLYTKEKQKRLDALLEIDNKKLLDELNPHYVMVLFKIAQTYNQLDDIEKAKQYFKKAFAINAKIYSEVHISTLQMKVLYAKFLKSRKQMDEVKKIVSEVKQIIQRDNINNKELDKWIKQLE